MDPFEHAALIVRERDPDRFIAALFAPETARRHLHALYAFDAEMARIRFVVSEPALGEIRLQWWRDAIVNRESGGNPLATALIETIHANHLPIDAFDAMLTARIFDLYNDPMPTMADFEGYAGETQSTLFQLASLCLGAGDGPGSADASGHAGVALLLNDALRRFGLDARRRQLFLPRDRFEKNGVDIETVFALSPTRALQRALVDLRETARDHLAKARRAIAALAPDLRLAFLPLAVVEPDLKRLDLGRPFDQQTGLSPWRRQLRIRRAARRGLG